MAQAVQSGGLSAIIDWAERNFSNEHAESEVYNFIKNAEKLAHFVQSHEDPDEIAKSVANKLQLLNPPCYLIAGSGNATFQTRMALARLKDSHPNHEAERFEKKYEHRVLFCRRPL